MPVSEDEGGGRPSYLRTTQSTQNRAEALYVPRRYSAPAPLECLLAERPPAAGAPTRRWAAATGRRPRSSSLGQHAPRRAVRFRSDGKGDEQPAAPAAERPRFKTRRSLRIARIDHSECLRGVALFKDCTPEFLDILGEQVETRIFLSGETIMYQGAFGDSMYILNNGEVDIWAGDIKVATLGSGSVFGEMAAICKDPGAAKRSATVRAAAFCECRVVTRGRLMRTIARFPEDKAIIEVERQRRFADLRAKGLLPLEQERSWCVPVTIAEPERGLGALWRKAKECAVMRRNSCGSVMAQPPPEPRAAGAARRSSFCQALVLAFQPAAEPEPRAGGPPALPDSRADAASAVDRSQDLWDAVIPKIAQARQLQSDAPTTFPETPHLLNSLSELSPPFVVQRWHSEVRAVSKASSSQASTSQGCSSHGYSSQQSSSPPRSCSKSSNGSLYQASLLTSSARCRMAQASPHAAMLGPRLADAPKAETLAAVAAAWVPAAPPPFASATLPPPLPSWPPSLISPTSPMGPAASSSATPRSSPYQSKQHHGSALAASGALRVSVGPTGVRVDTQRLMRPTAVAVARNLAGDGAEGAFGNMPGLGVDCAMDVDKDGVVEGSGVRSSRGVRRHWI